MGFPDMFKLAPSSALSYASPGMSRARRLFLLALETLSGIRRANRIYAAWQASRPDSSRRAMNDLLAACKMALRIEAPQWPVPRTDSRRLIIIANHPFGIPDGVAILALAEQLDRPVRILINTDLLRVPELTRFALPIDFSETKDALRTNMESRKEALACLARGETVVIFPSGGIATARSPFRRAEELPWKLFTAKLIHMARADVLPVYFEGQNSPLFHAASRISLSLRLSLIVPEAVRRLGRPIDVRIGSVIPYERLAAVTDRQALTGLLYEQVMTLRGALRGGVRALGCAACAAPGRIAPEPTAAG